MTWCRAQQSPDAIRDAQFAAIDTGSCEWGYWGQRPEKYSGWTNHSNRLIPVYLFGGSLADYAGERSAYRDAERIKSIYGYLPESTLNNEASYFDQTDIFRIQMDSVAAGKKNVILIVFDGMDWQTTWSAATYRNHAVTYREGRGDGLAFQDYRGAPTDYGSMVTSALCGNTTADIDHQLILKQETRFAGGYSAANGGILPWRNPPDSAYLLGQTPGLKHLVTDSASSATSMCSGIKTYNSAINVDLDGKESIPIARLLQERGFRIGVVTSVPISHATPAAAYANNVDRDDYQDLSRDLLGLPSSFHSKQALPGVDVLIGCGWGENKDDDSSKQGKNYVPGNCYLANEDLTKIDARNGGRYQVVQREAGIDGGTALSKAAVLAATNGQRLFGYFGVTKGHLPFATADGAYDPTRGASEAERYSKNDLKENPTLSEMAQTALEVLGQNNQKGFWLMIEAGDVDWANHNNNIDDSIGAVFSGEAAFKEVTSWVEKNSNWEDTLVIVTADHGHYLNIVQPDVIANAVKVLPAK